LQTITEKARVFSNIKRAEYPANFSPSAQLSYSLEYNYPETSIFKGLCISIATKRPLPT